MATASVSKYLSGKAKNSKGKIKYELPHREGREGTKESNYTSLKTKQGKERKGDLVPSRSPGLTSPPITWMDHVCRFLLIHSYANERISK